MTFRHRKLFSWKDGADFGDWFIPAYRNHPAQRASRVFRKLMARRVRKQEGRWVAAEIEQGLNDHLDEQVAADQRSPSEHLVWNPRDRGFLLLS